MTTHFEDIIRQNSQRLDDLKKTTEELQRELSEARVSLERELSRPSHGHAALTEQIPEYRGPAREQFSVRAPAQGHYVEEPLPYYAQDSRPYYAADEPPYAGKARHMNRGPPPVRRARGRRIHGCRPACRRSPCFRRRGRARRLSAAAISRTLLPMAFPPIPPRPAPPALVTLALATLTPIPRRESSLTAARARTAAGFPGAASSRSALRRASWSRCSLSSSPAAGVMAVQCGRRPGRSRQGVPEPRCGIRARPGQFRLREGHAPDPLGFRVADQ